MKPLPLPRRRTLRRGALLAGGLLAAAFLALNAVAYLQARAMTHYAPNGAPAPAFETLARRQKLKVLLAGGEDRRVGVDATRKIFANLSCPKRLQIFPGLGHQSYLAAQPEMWQANVRAFLDTSLPAASAPPPAPPR